MKEGKLNKMISIVITHVILNDILIFVIKSDETLNNQPR